MYKRIIDLNLKNSFFLWGPRQTGKSTILRERFPDALFIDLLKSEMRTELMTKPQRLREICEARPANQLVIIDEVQKVPELLDEVHSLIESRKQKFILVGSSARKLKKAHANMLGGRAWTKELRPLCWPELGSQFELQRALNHGLLPRIYDSENYFEDLRAYHSVYLKEEIFDEGLSRNLPAFSQFLELASLSDTEQVEYSTFASDVGVSSPTVKSYFEILQDTLIGEFLPIYRKRPKRRLSLTPKFYFFDVGIVNFLARRRQLEPGSETWGKAFENFIFNEIRAYKSYRSPDLPISFWRVKKETEVDFILGDMEIAIEVKGRANIREDHLKGLRLLKEDYPNIKRRIVVSMERIKRKTVDSIEVLPYHDFLEELWSWKL
ncbi:MAG: ATP-binding protein [Deltaproteobacteria bacterium]|nr:ATP-binding protein [Deltaproteobacteria bacterium]